MKPSMRIAIICTLLPNFVIGQSTQTKQKPRYHPAYGVMSPVRQIVNALGDRVQKSGNERVTMTGSLSRSGVASTVQIISELPGFLRIDEQGGKGKSLVYDLSSLKGASAIDDDDEGLAESFQNDTTEAFLNMFGAGASVRRLGDRFQVEGATGFGSEVDVYEAVTGVGVKRDKQAVIKKYMFDSNTGLLRQVVYHSKQSGKSVVTRTILSDYSVIDGYMLPGKIARMIDNVEAFTFVRSGATVQVAGTDNAFASPGR